MSRLLVAVSSLSSLLLFSTFVKAGELINEKSFAASLCQLSVGSWKQDCSSVTIGLVPDYDTFNIKLCTKDKYKCLILSGEAEQLNNYPTEEVKIFSVGQQEGEQIIQNWSGDLLLKPSQQGFTVIGSAEDVEIKIYFTE